MPGFAATALAALLPLAFAQQIGKIPEVHPRLTTQQCSHSGGCHNVQSSVVLDSSIHQIENISGQATIEGVNYAQNGVYTQGNSMTLRMYLNESGKINVPVSPRVYLLDPSGRNYQDFKLLNQELTFEADVSQLPCGMNGALYLTAMSPTGGRSAGNPAGAAYGTGYCDAQCPKSAYINGIANTADLGACCSEMDIWEANEASAQVTPHPCTKSGLYPCNGTECLNSQYGGVCDEWGCGFNSYSRGDHSFYGYGNNYSVNTAKPFTVVTQFLTNQAGVLDEIRRLYVQNGNVIGNSVVAAPAGDVTASGTVDSITPGYCNATAATFEDAGGFPQMSKALAEGMVLIFSIWNDQGGNMTWLDSGSAGPCDPLKSGPAYIAATDATTSVTFSNIRWGDINSTYTSQSTNGWGNWPSGGWPWVGGW